MIGRLVCTTRTPAAGGGTLVKYFYEGLNADQAPTDTGEQLPEAQEVTR